MTDCDLNLSYHQDNIGYFWRYINPSYSGLPKDIASIVLRTGPGWIVSSRGQRSNTDSLHIYLFTPFLTATVNWEPGGCFAPGNRISEPIVKEVVIKPTRAITSAAIIINHWAKKTVKRHIALRHAIADNYYIIEEARQAELTLQRQPFQVEAAVDSDLLLEEFQIDQTEFNEEWPVPHSETRYNSDSSDLASSGYHSDSSISLGF